MESNEIRRLNLINLLEDSGSNKSAFCRKCNLKPWYLDGLVKSKKPIVDLDARNIEMTFGLENGWMDLIHPEEIIISGNFMTINEIRLKKLLYLAKKFGQKELSERVGLHSTYISRLKNPKEGRKIGDKLARRIESVLDIPFGWMDKDPGYGEVSAQNFKDTRHPLVRRLEVSINAKTITDNDISFFESLLDRMDHSNSFVRKLDKAISEKSLTKKDVSIFDNLLNSMIKNNSETT